MLIDVANRFCADAGYAFSEQRAVVIDILQRASDELYALLECNNIYRECTLVVPPNKIVALPEFVGEIRGCRAHTADMVFDTFSLASPRYVNQTWQYRVKNWREMAESPIKLSLNAINPLTIECDVIEDTPVTLSISGQTGAAEKLVEEVLLDTTPIDTTNSFGLQIYGISCREARTGNIVIKDSDGTEIAKLLNTQTFTRYRLVDVSQVFWSQDTSDGSSLVDFLYKLPLIKYVNDTDVFYAGNNYDDAWYYYAMYLFKNTKLNAQADAQKFYQQAVTAAQKDKSSEEQQELKKLSFGRNKFYGLFGTPGNYYGPWNGGYPWTNA